MATAKIEPKVITQATKTTDLWPTYTEDKITVRMFAGRLPQNKIRHAYFSVDSRRLLNADNHYIVAFYDLREKSLIFMRASATNSSRQSQYFDLNTQYQPKLCNILRAAGLSSAVTYGGEAVRSGPYTGIEFKTKETMALTQEQIQVLESLGVIITEIRRN